jgi:DNA-binding transcriptional MerR regulator
MAIGTVAILLGVSITTLRRWDHNHNEIQKKKPLNIGDL